MLEECLIEELNEKERYYIKYFNTLFPNGFNLTEGGDNAGHFIKLTPEKLDCLIQDLIDNVLDYKQLEKKYNISHQMIYDIKNGKS